LERANRALTDKQQVKDAIHKGIMVKNLSRPATGCGPNGPAGEEDFNIMDEGSLT
jgi:cation diffusion facilitator CzcD-associated flavoprotein CzcO